ncbi:MAG: GtrA family protein [Clostridiaceae bacterium]|nr:GtrA family protein [Clostridiaceae bacterium]
MDKKKSKMARELWRFVKFGLFSASAGLIETGIFYLLGLVPSFGYWICYLPALVVSVIWNFTLNRRFTFQSAANIPAAMLKVFAYYLVFTPLSTILGNWLVEVRFADVPAAVDIVYFSTLAVNFITEFLYQRYYVFRGKVDNREAPTPTTEE